MNASVLAHRNNPIVLVPKSVEQYRMTWEIFSCSSRDLLFYDNTWTGLSTNLDFNLSP